MKRIIACVILALTLALTCVSASADGTITIESADFDITLNSDGTASVTETWTVAYDTVGMGFDRYIDKNNSDVRFSERDAIYDYAAISDVKVLVNGKEIEGAAGGNDTFKVDDSAEDSVLISITSPSAAETKVYTISYTLTGAVKDVGRDARFAFVLVGKKFPYTSNNLTATIIPPDGAELTAAEAEEFASNVKIASEDGAVQFYLSRCGDTFYVNVSASEDAFADAELVKYSPFAQTMRRLGQSIADNVIYIVIALFVVLAVILALFGDKFRRAPLEKAVRKELANGSESASGEGAENPKAEQGTRSATGATKLSVTALAAYKAVEPYSRIRPRKTSAKIPAMLAFAVLECVERGFIKAKDDALIIGECAKDAPEYQKSVMNLLRSFGEKEGAQLVFKKGGAKLLSRQCMSNDDTLANYLISFYALIPDEGGKKLKRPEGREEYKKAYELKLRVNAHKNKASFADILSAVVAGAKTTDERVFAALYTPADKLFASDNDSLASAMSESFALMKKLLLKSK